MINEKSNNLSGGERQKISIMRQLVKDPDFMIFDEPTSALDTASTTAFIQYLQKIKHNKIILVISHDPAIIVSSDIQIIVQVSEDKSTVSAV